MSIESNNLMNLADGQVLYNDLRDRQEDIVKVSDTQPTTPGTKIWMTETAPGSVQIPTYAEFENLEGDKAPVIVKSASGSIVSFDDGAEMPVRDCVVQIEPVQDLHGQSSPYPAGGGKNKAEGIIRNCNINASGVLVENGTYDMAYGKVSQGTTYTITAGSGFVGGFFTSVPNIGSVDYDGGRVVQESATFTAPITGYVAFRCVAGYTTYQLEEGHTATSYAPYSNIFCPITGWTGVTAYRTGKNIYKTNQTSRTNNGVTYTVNSDGSVSLANTATSTSYFNANMSYEGNNRQYFRYFHVGTYSLRAVGTSSNIRAYFAGKLVRDTSISVTFSADQGNGVTFTLTEPCYLYFQIYVANGTETNVTLKPMVVVGSTIPDSYEDYIGNAYAITFPSEAGTVYGGSLDVTTGVLTVDRASVDLGTLTWSTSNSGSHLAPVNGGKAVVNAIKTSAICSEYKAASANDVRNNDNQFALGLNNASTVVVYDSRYDSESASNFKNHMSGVQLCYPLATPITYQLTPVQILTLIGKNNIWADTGDIAVDYCADTKTYVDDAIPSVPVQDVQINGTSILIDGVAKIPTGQNGLGVVQQAGMGVAVDGSGRLILSAANAYQIKGGTHSYSAIEPATQHTSVFYGLAKLAGADMKDSSNAVGTYTDEAKQKIHKMLDVPGNSDIAYIESSLTAQRKYDPGDYFVDEYGILSKATAAIANGGSLVLDTNYEHIGQGGLANDFLKPATLVASYTLEEEPTSTLIEVTLSKPCRFIVVHIANNGENLPGWSYLQINGKRSSPVINVNTTGNYRKSTCIIDALNKFAMAFSKQTNDTYPSAGVFTVNTSSFLLNSDYITKVCIATNNASNYKVGFEMNIYGR